ncbi:MAG: aminotransferase class I/II-fold pyridoxal phosphate-dependent enzyme [Acidimicrobiia bacterium]|nr:MAG: aminotransferase class I/II-fold pyridoxal phosphate-dependent enzyme [Acidimicrobiia bacterium]
MPAPHHHPATAMLGLGHDPADRDGSLKPPLFPTSTFAFPSAAAGKRAFEIAVGIAEPEDGEEMAMIYSRLSNPGLEVLEERVAYLDGMPGALSFSSGMAAISTTFLAHLRPGDLLLYSAPVYGGTDHLITEMLGELGIHVGELRPHMAGQDLEELLAASPGALKMVYVETPANPTNALFDLEALASFAHAREAILVVDNTFLGPTWQRPVEQGADLVLYSATKFLGGHSDLIAGMVSGGEALTPIAAMRTFLGTMCDPWTAWLLTRSLETLDVRMHRQAENTGRLAEALAGHPALVDLSYLGALEPGSPDADVFERQCLGPGSMLSLWFSDEESAFRFLDALEVVKLAVSLGSTESLAQHPATMTHAGVDPEAKERLRITGGLVRISVGIEHFEDLRDDVLKALAAV